MLRTLTSAVNTGAAIGCGRAGPSMERFIRIGLRSPADSPFSQDPVHFRPSERAARGCRGPRRGERSDPAERRGGRPGRRLHLPGRQAPAPLGGDNQPGPARPPRPPPPHPEPRVEIPLLPPAPGPRPRRQGALRRRQARQPHAGRGLTAQRQGRDGAPLLDPGRGQTAELAEAGARPGAGSRGPAAPPLPLAGAREPRRVPATARPACRRTTAASSGCARSGSSAAPAAAPASSPTARATATPSPSPSTTAPAPTPTPSSTSSAKSTPSRPSSRSARRSPAARRRCGAFSARAARSATTPPTIRPIPGYADLKETSDLIEGATHFRPCLFRPPTAPRTQPSSRPAPRRG